MRIELPQICNDMRFRIDLIPFDVDSINRCTDRVTPDAVLEMAATFILIYGMLIVRKETGNAWGCILIFFVYWNAI